MNAIFFQLVIIQLFQIVPRAFAIRTNAINMLIADQSVTLTAKNCYHDKLATTIESKKQSFSYNGSNALQSVISFTAHPFKIRSTFYSPNHISLRSFSIRFTLIFVYSLPIVSTIGSATICPGVRIKEIGGITCELRQEILEAHNEIRQIVAAGLVNGQPPAANMRKLYWDKELAEGAQDWANHCTFKHNELADREIARFQVGQNIAVTKNRGSSPDEKEFTRQVNNWFDENTAYTWGRISEDVQNSGHYSQLIWAETYLVGCGFSRFQDSMGNISYRLYVCHYGPSGNVQGENPYEIGKRNCPYGTTESRKYDALCAVKSVPSDNCESLAMPQGKEEMQQGAKNARRSERLEDYQPVGKSRRNLSPVVHYENNYRGLESPLSSEDIAVCIFFRFILKIT